MQLLQVGSSDFNDLPVIVSTWGTNDFQAAAQKGKFRLFNG
jgi:hypothetical protein